MPLVSGLHARGITMQRVVLNQCFPLYKPDSTTQSLGRGLKCSKIGDALK